MTKEVDRNQGNFSIDRKSVKLAKSHGNIICFLKLKQTATQCTMETRYDTQSYEKRQRIQLLSSYEHRSCGHGGKKAYKYVYTHL